MLPTLGLEIICVVPRGLGAASCDRKGVAIIEDEGVGVYAAYSQGIRAATGQYVWLLGDDDYPLDGLRYVAPAIQRNEVDLIVCPVLLSSGRSYRPHRLLFFLILRNWCQQGVIYRRAIFQEYSLHRRFKIQADHYLNVLLCADVSLRKMYINHPVCVFGVAGISSRIRDERFRKIRPVLARRVLGKVGYFFFWALVLPASAIKRRLVRWL